MKSIKQQYIDLTEGKMSQGNFMRNLRMTVPQYVTNVTSFGDAVRILKNKGIISEVLTTEEEEVFSQGAQDESITTTNTTAGYDSVSEENDETSNSDAEFDTILKQLEDEMAGERAVKSDVLDEPLEEAEGITADAVAVEKAIDNKKIDPAQVKAAAEKAIRGDSTDLAMLMLNAGNLFENKEPKAVDENLEEVTLGITTEHECFPAKSYDEIEKMVKKNIKKNPLYYTNYKLTGIRDYEAQTMDSSKPEEHQMKFYTEKTAVDTARGMKKVKMPKKDEKKKLKENVDEKMRFQDLPADPEKYKIVRDSKNYIIKATNADGVEFQKGDTAKTYDGEEIKIVKFEENQGKVKAIYNKGMFFAGIDIDGLEAGKPEFRPGVNLGGSMEKLKNMVREIMKEMESADQEIDDMAMVMDEYFDGRDNLTNISDDTK
jgi:hypothetical protein